MGQSKADLADAVYRIHGGLSRREAVHLIDVIFGRIARSLESGRPVLISGFGSFEVHQRGARKGRNPRTGEIVSINASRRPVFRPSKTMVRGLNGRAEDGGDVDAR